MISAQVPSETSGVPRLDDRRLNDKRTKTAFGLYRSSRAPVRLVEPSAWSYGDAQRTCKATTECSNDKTILILLANDPFYGGLGDEVIVATNSRTSGALALRHELGHALGDVGEEYDGGDDYSGGNFAEQPRPCHKGEGPRRVLNRQVWPCAPWLSKAVEPYKSALALAQWPWRRPPIDVHFLSDLPRATIDLSVAGGLDVDVLIDGRALRPKYIGGPTLDRRFARIQHTLAPKKKHTLSFRERTTAMPQSNHSWAPPPLLCHFQVHIEKDGNSSDVGLFPVFSRKGAVLGYRPTKSDCLMRDVTSNSLCPVCRDLILRRVLEITKPLQHHDQLQPLVDAGLVHQRWSTDEPGCWDVVSTFSSPDLRPVQPDVLETHAWVYRGDGDPSSCTLRPTLSIWRSSTEASPFLHDRPPPTTLSRRFLPFGGVLLVLIALSFLGPHDKRPLVLLRRILRRRRSIIPTASSNTKAG